MPATRAQTARAALMSNKPSQSAHLRTVVSRFGGMLEESNAVLIPPQAPASPPSSGTGSGFNTRHMTEQTNVYAGIPGYMGFKPHGSHPAILGADAAPKPHARPMSSLDTSGQPFIMPVVGYSGHLRRSQESFGTSHWKNAGAVTSNRSAASKPWDNRDSAGRPFGGWTPGDGGLYEPDPEESQKRKEAEEACELLELRSLGIRNLIRKQPEIGGSRGRPRGGLTL